MKDCVIVIVVVIIVISMLLLIAAFTFSEPEGDIKKITKKQFDRSCLLEYITVAEKEKSDLNENSWSSSYPMLQPERFRRRMKMLFAVDINDYPENALIRTKGGGRNYMIIEDGSYDGYYISVEDQKFYDLEKKVGITDDIPEEHSPFGGLEDNIGEDYGILILDYLFYNDQTALDLMATYKYRLCKESLGEKWEENEMAEDLLHMYNIYYDIYTYMHTVKLEFIQAVDRNKEISYSSNSRFLRSDYSVGSFSRTSALRADLQFLYISEEKKKDRRITCNTYDTSDDIPVDIDNITINSFCYFNNYFPWKKNTSLRSIAEYLSFLVQLQQKEFNKFVIQYMSGQFETYEAKEVANRYREQIRTNNYFGHAVLREFCENPEREMPTLEKVGTSFNATVVNPNTLLYLEPYSDSYDIDTMQPAEVFKVYEMGYDDYFFVEVTKPVESPVAGPDGYAMILDRTETVYGYIRKKDVKEVSETEIASQQIKSQVGESKSGIIDDPDGTVNICKENSAESEIVGKIVEKEIFYYWEIPDSNWWYVETKNGMNGFVHKSRIRENIDAGSWILDEKG